MLDIIFLDAELVFSGIFGYGSGAALKLSPGCVGNEGSIFKCPPTNHYGYNAYLTYYMYLYTNYFYNNIIGLRCRQGDHACAYGNGNKYTNHFIISTVPPVHCDDGDVRLVNATSGPNTIEGRVEACYADQWGPVYVLKGYQFLWTLREASVVCRQLQYSPVAVNTYTISTYGSAHISGNVSLSQVYCTGYESKLIYCYHIPPLYNIYNYFSGYAVTVSCQGE